MLSTRTFGTAGGTPLIIAHGLFGSARNWGVIAKTLAQTRPVIAVDMRNHGTSPWFARQTYPAMAEDLSEVIAANTTRADVLGHSMGGKAAMALALTHPERLCRLIVVDIAPIAYSHTQSHLIDAMQSLDITRFSSRRQASEALSEQIDDPTLRAFLLQSLDMRARPPRWRINLAALRRDMPEIIGFPEFAGRFYGPTLFITGEASNYVREDHKEKIKALFPNANFVTIPKAGHWIHAEQPKAFLAAVEDFLRQPSGAPA